MTLRTRTSAIHVVAVAAIFGTATCGLPFPSAFPQTETRLWTKSRETHNAWLQVWPFRPDDTASPADAINIGRLFETRSLAELLNLACATALRTKPCWRDAILRRIDPFRIVLPMPSCSASSSQGLQLRLVSVDYNVSTAMVELELLAKERDLTVQARVEQRGRVLVVCVFGDNSGDVTAFGIGNAGDTLSMLLTTALHLDEPAYSAGAVPVDSLNINESPGSRRIQIALLRSTYMADKAVASCSGKTFETRTVCLQNVATRFCGDGIRSLGCMRSSTAFDTKHAMRGQTIQCLEQATQSCASGDETLFHFFRWCIYWVITSVVWMATGTIASALALLAILSAVDNAWAGVRASAEAISILMPQVTLPADERNR